MLLSQHNKFSLRHRATGDCSIEVSTVRSSVEISETGEHVSAKPFEYEYCVADFEARRRVCSTLVKMSNVEYT